jgi:hypothetical protein
MLLIGVFSLALLWCTSAQAEPVSISLLGTLGIVAAQGSLLAAATTFLLTTVVSFALSFVASALFKPPGKSQNSGYSEGGSAQRVDNLITVREPVAPRNIVYGTRRVAGKIVFAHVTSGDGIANRFLYFVIVFAGHPIEAWDTLFLNDQPVQVDGNGMVYTGEFTGLVRLICHTGQYGPGGADGTLIAETNGVWQESDQLRGAAYIVARFEYQGNPEFTTYGGRVYQAGVPNITAIVKGKRVYDPRDDTVKWSANSALCLADYLTDPYYGLISWSDIDEVALIASANASEELVVDNFATGSTHRRYDTDGELLSSATVEENIGYLLSACHGRLHYDGDKYRIIAGVYIAPTSDFTDDDLRAGPTINVITPRDKLFNAAKGTYYEASGRYIKTDFVPYAPTAYAAADGETIWKDIDLPMTTSGPRAQRIAKIEVQRSRQQITATMPCKLAGWRVQAGDTIRWTSARYGWTNKLFEVHRCTLVPGEDGTLGVDLELAETAPEIFDWLSSDAGIVDPAPNTNLPSAATVLPPSNFRVSESLYVARQGGGVKARVTLAWDQSPDAFLHHYEGYVRAVGTTVWKSIGQTRELTIDWNDAEPGLWDFGLWAVNHRGVFSTGLVQRLQVAGLAAVPSPPAGFSVVSFGNVGGFASWEPPADLDVREGGYMVIRHTPKLVGALWADGTSIGQRLYPGGAGSAALPLKSGTYMARFQDTTGQFSDFVSFVCRQDSALAFTPLSGGTLDEAPGFTGTKTDCYVDTLTGDLLIQGRDLFSEVPLVSAMGNFSYPGGVKTDAAAQYDWSTAIDLGSKLPCRLTVTAETVVEDVFDLVGSRSGNVSTWPSFGGAISGDEGDCWTMVQTTDDDPFGTPTWSEWQRIDAAEFNCRGFRLRTFLKSNDDVVNVRVLQLSARVEGVV